MLLRKYLFSGHFCFPPSSKIKSVREYLVRSHHDYGGKNGGLFANILRQDENLIPNSFPLDLPNPVLRHFKNLFSKIPKKVPFKALTDNLSIFAFPYFYFLNIFFNLFYLFIYFITHILMTQPIHKKIKIIIVIFFSYRQKWLICRDKIFLNN